MEIQNESTFLAALKGPINLFIGAGFSVLAQDAQGRELPIGSRLATELADRFDLRDLANLDLAKLCTIISATRGDELRDFLIERLSVSAFDEYYNNLERLQISTIFTTNIDNLIHKIYEQSTKYYVNDVDINGPVYRDRRAVELFMLHGSVLNPRRRMRLGTLEVASSFGADPDRWRYLQMRLKRNPTIFWGYAFEDAATLEAITSHVAGAGAPSDAWILLRASSVESGVIEYFKALNLQIIIGDTAELLEFIYTHVPEEQLDVAVETVRQTSSLFPSESIPAPSTVPMRQIVDFFRGATPVWSDIFSGILYRTSHYYKVRDSIHSGAHTIVTGVPASGKTAILMQLAAEFGFEGHKLIFNGLSRPEAALIARRLEGERALIFIDNFTNDVEAFSTFCQYPNITLVVGDRDYSLSTIIHRIYGEDFKVVDVTGLNDQDLQGCRSSIPVSIRTPEFVHPEVTHGVRPSLYEFIEANTTEPTLRERFEEALRNLRAESPRLAEMLLFVAYVHSCRTPVSMDMALAYWGNVITDYTEIYDMMTKVGSILTEYEGDLAIEPQDYFAARSMLVAESIINAATDAATRKMLIVFHGNVSTLRICHYNVFKRYAYDATRIGRVFSSWQEGEAFYESIYQKSPSPYIHQHQALFLSKRGRNAEAFQAIDKALSEAGATNWTIKNSHAIIMFRANISFATDTTARQSLDRSMRILMHCYHSDRRKAFHAMTFADHATKYWDAYRDDIAREYLQYADKWLTEQRQEEPWMDRLTILRRIVQKRLLR